MLPYFLALKSEVSFFLAPPPFNPAVVWLAAPCKQKVWVHLRKAEKNCDTVGLLALSLHELEYNLC